MPYLVETWDRDDAGSLRADTREEHLGYLDVNARLLLACGAKLDDAGEVASGGIYLLDLESRDDAEAFIAADPFSRVNLFERVVVTRWRQAYLGGVSYL
ncbi:YciI family protein [Arthrobacter sp.]|uniref:YciI family protein n=1 Tax=Arthrobacter sp. TaxID=1667 RepID=UPI003A8D5A35